MINALCLLHFNFLTMKIEMCLDHTSFEKIEINVFCILFSSIYWTDVLCSLTDTIAELKNKLISETGAINQPAC